MNRYQIVVFYVIVLFGGILIINLYFNIKAKIICKKHQKEWENIKKNIKDEKTLEQEYSRYISLCGGYFPRKGTINRG